MGLSLGLLAYLSSSSSLALRTPGPHLWTGALCPLQGGPRPCWIRPPDGRVGPPLLRKGREAASDVISDVITEDTAQALVDHALQVSDGIKLLLLCTSRLRSAALARLLCNSAQLRCSGSISGMLRA